MNRKFSLRVPPFDPGKHESVKTYFWWSWHPLYPVWSKSCWGATTIREAWAILKKPATHSMRNYHNKLIMEADGRFLEIADLPCQKMEVWLKIARDRKAERKARK